MSGCNDIKTLMERFYEDKTPTLLWHYTDCNGLLGVIRKQALTFRFTRSDCLNDISEGKDIEKYYSIVCESLLKDNRISKSFYNAIKDIKPTGDRFFVYPSPSETGNDSGKKMAITSASYGKCETYICCFSIAQDSLEMWRYYSQKDGYALGILTLGFENLHGEPFEDFNEDRLYDYVRFAKVMYGEQEKKDQLKKIILECYNHVASGEMETSSSARYITIGINQLQYIFKDSCFSNEQEYRLIYYRPIEKPKRMKQNLPEIKYRNKQGVVVPYVEINFSDRELKLSQLCISPFLKKTNAFDLSTEFLSKNGFKNCQVYQSDLPVRF